MPEYVPVVLQSNPPETPVLYGILLVSEQVVLVRSSKAEVDTELTSPNRQNLRYITSTLTNLGWTVVPLTRID